MGKAFGDLLRGILSDFDILQVNPMLPAFRELAAPVLRRAVEQGRELAESVLVRNQELATAGYHAQVHVEPGTSFVFLLEEGKRLALRRHEDDYVLNSRRFSAAELMDRAASLSPNALLRPVVQDSILPTAAYIGGPAELAYLAQSAVIYKALLGRMPATLPRSGFTLVDERAGKLLTRYGLSVPDFFHGEEALRERMAAKLVSPQLNAALQKAAGTIDGALESLHREISGFDPTLAQALERSSRKIRYQIGKIERKTSREAIRRDARAEHDAGYLCGLVYPERHLQERLYSILPFLAKHGIDLASRLYQAVDVSCPDHRLVMV
jgi:bacillithiol synthase